MPRSSAMSSHNPPCPCCVDVGLFETSFSVGSVDAFASWRLCDGPPPGWVSAPATTRSFGRGSSTSWPLGAGTNESQKSGTYGYTIRGLDGA